MTNATPFIFKTMPYAHQLDAYNRSKDMDYFALLADMGVGKTKIVIDIITHKHLNRELDRVLVIAPNAVHSQWVDEQFPIHCSCKWGGFVYTSSKRTKNLKTMDRIFMNIRGDRTLIVHTMNLEAFAKETGVDHAVRFFNTSATKRPPMIIIDEASRIKNPEAKTTRNIKKLAKLYPDAFKWVLTGTPAAKSPLDMWSIYDFLKPQYMGCSYLAFKHTHVVTIRKKIKVKNRIVSMESTISPEVFQKVKVAIAANINARGYVEDYTRENIQKMYGLSYQVFHYILKSNKFKKFRNLDVLQKKIAPVTYSVSKKECLDLPEKIYQQVEFELNPTQKKLIRQLAEYSVTMYEDKELTVDVKALLGLRVLQICGGFFSHHTDIEGHFESTAIKGGNKKLEYIQQDVPELGDQQFIVWAVYVPELNLINQTLSKTHDVGLLSGAVSKQERIDIISAFKRGELQGLISQPSVGGYGLNLQGAGVQYWYSRNYRTEARLQAEDRSHRIGITKSPIYKDLIYNVKWEHTVLESLKEGQALNETFTDRSINDMFAFV